MIFRFAFRRWELNNIKLDTNGQRTTKQPDGAVTSNRGGGLCINWYELTCFGCVKGNPHLKGWLAVAPSTLHNISFLLLNLRRLKRFQIISINCKRLFSADFSKQRGEGSSCWRGVEFQGPFMQMQEMLMQEGYGTLVRDEDQKRGFSMDTWTRHVGHSCFVHSHWSMHWNTQHTDSATFTAFIVLLLHYCTNTGNTDL